MAPMASRCVMCGMSGEGDRDGGLGGRMPLARRISLLWVSAWILAREDSDVCVHEARPSLCPDVPSFELTHNSVSSFGLTIVCS